MVSEIGVGSIAGLRVTVRPSFFIHRLTFTVALALLGYFVFDLSPARALLGALIAVALDAFAVLMHQLGHAWVAQRIGWPMVGIRFWGLFSTCVYPPDEPRLPPQIHILRALGGPFTSLLLGSITGALAYWLLPREGLVWLLVLFWVVDNVALKFALAFGPFSWTDGPTIRYWRKRMQPTTS